MRTIPTVFSSRRWRRSSYGSGAPGWQRSRSVRICAGIALLALSLGVFIAGRYGSELFLTRVSMIGVVAGLVLFLRGMGTPEGAGVSDRLPAADDSAARDRLQSGGVSASDAGVAIGRSRDFGERRPGAARRQRAAPARQGARSCRSVLGHSFPDVVVHARGGARIFHRASGRSAHRHRASPRCRLPSSRMRRGSPAPASRRTGSARRQPKASSTRFRAG